LYEIEPIARIRTDFPTKFGLPRQGCVEELTGLVEFEKKYRDKNAVRGLSMYSHIWLIWLFSKNLGKGFSATVRPPKLGGNERIGVFATRSPFRPNSIGMTPVKILKIYDRPSILVSGIDMADNTPIIDIKPYLPYDRIDSIRAPKNGRPLKVSGEPLQKIPKDKREPLIKLLREDPRPAYQKDGRRYGFFFSGYEIFFTVEKGELLVLDIFERKDADPK
jgi:tRNA-Thr(GGU) m(6)t(6)A37 methyltransferase TsaA